MEPRFLLILRIVAILSYPFGGMVNGQVAYSCWNGDFYSFESISGEGRVISSPPGFWSLDHAPDGTLFGASRTTDKLYKFTDPQSGAVEEFADLPGDFSGKGGITIAPDGRTMIISLNLNGRDLWEIDLQTKESRYLGYLQAHWPSLGVVSGLELDEKGSLFVHNGGAGQAQVLYQVDLSTMEATQIGPGRFGLAQGTFSSGSGLCYADGRLYMMMDSGGHRLASIDPSTGVAELLGEPVSIDGSAMLCDTLAILHAFRKDSRLRISRDNDTIRVLLEKPVRGNTYFLEKASDSAQWAEVEGSDKLGSGEELWWSEPSNGSQRSVLYRVGRR